MQRGDRAGTALHLRSKHNVLLFKVLQLLLQRIQMEVILDRGGRLVPLQPGGESPLRREGDTASHHLANHTAAHRGAFKESSRGCGCDSGPSGLSLAPRKTAQLTSLQSRIPTLGCHLASDFWGTNSISSLHNSGMPSICQELF